MNHLSLYLLLAPQEQPQPIIPPITQPARTAASPDASPARQKHPAVYNPHRPDGKRLLQASYRPARAVQPKFSTIKAVGFGAVVVANTIGFLVMASGLLLLVEIARASLA